MDATRTRRTKDQHRQQWYARQRQFRFARHFGFAGPGTRQPYPVGARDRS